MSDFVIKDGVLTQYTGKSTSVTIPSGVQKIGMSAFWKNCYVRQVIIPEGVQIIDREAFMACDELRQVTFPESLISIEAEAFKNCGMLEQVVIPQNATKVGAGAFRGCCSLKSVSMPSHIPSAYQAFWDCRSLPSVDGMIIVNNCVYYYTGKAVTVVIPEGVTEIGAGAFRHASGLKTVKLASTVRCIGDQAFEMQKSLREVIGVSALTEIGFGAFENCTALEKLELPDTLTVVGKQAFKNCESLKSLNIPTTVSEVGTGAFDGCTGLASSGRPLVIGNQLVKYLGDEKEYTVPDGVRVIGSGAFNRNFNIERVVLPNSVVEISAEAFDFCTKLQEIHIPDSVKKIGRRAFANCNSLVSLAIPETVEDLGDCVVASCEKLEKLTLPGCMRSLSLYEFSSCRTIKEIIVPEGVEYIASSAFYYCPSLERIVLPSTLKKAEQDAIEQCQNLKEIVVSDEVVNFLEPKAAKKLLTADSLVYGYLEGYATPGAAHRKLLEAKIKAKAGRGKYAKQLISTNNWVGLRNLLQICKNIPAEEMSQYLEWTKNNSEATKIIADALAHRCGDGGSIRKEAGKSNPVDSNETATAAPTVNEKAKEASVPEKKMPPENSAKTHLLILVIFQKNNCYSKVFEFPGDYSLAFDAEQQIFNWKTCNRADDLGKSIDGLGSAVNFSCTFTNEGENAGGLYDVLVECYGKKGDDLFEEFCADMASAINNDSAIAVALASVGFKNGKRSGSWLLMDYSNSTLTEGEEEWAVSETDAIEKAKVRIEAMAESCKKAAEAERLRKEAEETERLRKEAEERERKAAEEAERRRKVAEEAERYRLAVLAENRNRYDQLMKQITDQNRIISENRGWFGTQAKARKTARAQLAALQAQLSREFPNGRP